MADVVLNNFSIPETELEFSYVRASGPGGQKVNKTSSKAVLTWNVKTTTAISEALRARFLAKHHRRISSDGEVIIQCETYRQQSRNREECLNKLAELLAVANTKEKPRKKTKPTRASKERRIKDKKLQSEKKLSRQKPRFS